MHKEQAPAPANFNQRLHATPPERIEDADLSIVHERVSLDEFKQMGFDVCADNAVGFDDGTCLGVNVIPWPSDLRLQPTPQWAKQISQTFAPPVPTFDAFELWQKFLGEVGPSPLLVPTGI